MRRCSVDNSESKSMRGEMAQHAYKNIEFIQQQTKAFCDWARRYGEALHACIYYPPENLVTDPDKHEREMAEIAQAEKEYREGKRADKPVWFPDVLVGYATLTAAQCLFLKDDQNRMGFCPAEMMWEVNPLGVIGIPSYAQVAPRPLTEDEQRRAPASYWPRSTRRRASTDTASASPRSRRHRSGRTSSTCGTG